jgi:hypothetical protein
MPATAAVHEVDQLPVGSCPPFRLPGPCNLQLVQDVVAIQLSSNASFTVTEVAAASVQSFEQATVDLGSVQTLGIVR